MIRINVEKSNDKIQCISLCGHANYSDYGTDIVCAAVSSTYLCTVNAILSINKSSIEVNKNKDMQVINVINYDEITNKLLDNMLNCFISLESQYPKNISIKSKEE